MASHHTVPDTWRAIPGLLLRDHWFTLPLDYQTPGRNIRVYARELTTPDQANTALSYLVFFQGGPGFGAPRPMGNTGWIKRALKDYRVLLLDQRGTGRSTPVTTASLLAEGAPDAQANYLMHFRADNIVRDAEAIRRALIGDAKWSILGQSYGGFCAMRYLSAAPEGLNEAFITGGIPSVTRPTDDVYRATYPRVMAKNARYYARYPDDVQRVRELVSHLQHHRVTLPSGGTLTPRRFLQLGLQLGMSDGFEALHYLIEDAWEDIRGQRALSWAFLVQLEQMQHFDTNPIFSLLHEACYTQRAASNWSAERLLAEHPAFALDSEDHVLFTGEMIYPWMFDCYAQLAPLKEAANILATTNAWPMLYDPAVLAHNKVPVVAAVYYDDMYVPREFAEETSAQVPSMTLWHTNEYEHNGLRADGPAVLGRLIDLRRGKL